MIQKIRIEYQTIDQALEKRKTHGGRIAELENGKIYWYSFGHTMSDIFYDHKGNATIY